MKWRLGFNEFVVFKHNTSFYLTICLKKFIFNIEVNINSLWDIYCLSSVFPLSTILSLMETSIKINLKKIIFLEILAKFVFKKVSIHHYCYSWRYPVAINVDLLSYIIVFSFLNIFSLLRSSRKANQWLWIYTKFHGMSQLHIFWHRTYVCKLFFYRISYTYPFERIDLHRNSVHQFKTNYFYSSLKNPEHKTKSLHKNPTPTSFAYLSPNTCPRRISIYLNTPGILCCI